MKAHPTNLNQIAQKAHVLNVLDVRRYDENAAALNRAVVEITNAVMLPRRMEKTKSSKSPQPSQRDEIDQQRML